MGIVPDVASEPLWLKLISRPGTPLVLVNHFDCVSANGFKTLRRRRDMYTALAGTFIILSIGILMAHAMDAFRSSR